MPDDLAYDRDSPKSATYRTRLVDRADDDRTAEKEGGTQ
jgi:hypothetical protein